MGLVHLVQDLLKFGGWVTYVCPMPPVAKQKAVPQAFVLAPAEREVIEFFVHLGRHLSLPRSVGEIYGLLFATGGAHTLDDLVQRLQISKGSASQGLRVLREAGAVRVTFLPGDRKDYYEAELELTALVRRFLHDQVSAKMEEAGRRLEHLQSVVLDPDNAAPAGLDGRVERLQSWQRKANRLAPLVTAFLKI
jgi:HTH-type transcriptional regulator, glycine betaine synthesis regulator